MDTLKVHIGAVDERNSHILVAVVRSHGVGFHTFGSAVHTLDWEEDILVALFGTRCIGFGIPMAYLSRVEIGVSTFHLGIPFVPKGRKEWRHA